MFLTLNVKKSINVKNNKYLENSRKEQFKYLFSNEQ